MSAVTKAEMDTLRHSLGLTRSEKPYRNYFAVSPPGTSWDEIQGLVAKGLMFEGRRQSSGMAFFHVSDAGCALCGTTRAEAEA